MNANASSSRHSAETTPSWHLEEADDPQDWKESYAFLKELDATLRCDVCYNIFTAPVSVKDCNHIFCSACVRSAINQPDPIGKHCPKCYKGNVYDSSLTAQPLIERTAEAWKVARAGLMKKQKEEQEGSGELQRSPETFQRPTKRSRRDSREEISDMAPPRRSARSTSAKIAKQSAEEIISVGSESDDDDIDDPHQKNGETKRSNGIMKRREDKDYRSLQASDLAECPLCSRKVTLIVLNQHLDKGCESSDPNYQDTPDGAKSVSKWFQKPIKITSSQPRRRLARPNYLEMKIGTIQKLLIDAGLSKLGSRERMTERHRHWVTLYNANLDASENRRKSDGQLKRELDEWEKGQEVSSSRARILSEEKSRTYMLNNDDHFRDLLKTARESHMKNKEAHYKSKDESTKNGESVGNDEMGERLSSPFVTLETQTSQLNNSL